MDERVKDYLEKANSHWNDASGDDFGQDRNFHTRKSLEMLIGAVEALAGRRWKNGELVPVEQPQNQPAPQPAAPVCPLCGERVIASMMRGTPGVYDVYHETDCSLGFMRVRAADEVEALALFARITQAHPASRECPTCRGFAVVPAEVLEALLDARHYVRTFGDDDREWRGVEAKIDAAYRALGVEP